MRKSKVFLDAADRAVLKSCGLSSRRSTMPIRHYPARRHGEPRRLGGLCRRCSFAAATLCCCPTRAITASPAAPSQPTESSSAKTFADGPHVGATAIASTYLLEESMGAAIGLQAAAVTPQLCAVAVEDPYARFRRKSATNAWAEEPRLGPLFWRTIGRPCSGSDHLHARSLRHLPARCGPAGGG